MAGCTKPGNGGTDPKPVDPAPKLIPSPNPSRNLNPNRKSIIRPISRRITGTITDREQMGLNGPVKTVKKPNANPYYELEFDREGHLLFEREMKTNGELVGRYAHTYYRSRASCQDRLFEKRGRVPCL